MHTLFPCLRFALLPLQLLALGLIAPGCSEVSPPTPSVEKAQELVTDPEEKWFRGHPDAARGNVIYVSESGNDQAQGTAEDPYQTIARALQKAVPGDTIQLQPGTFREAVTISTGGKDDAPIVIRGSSSEDGRNLSRITTSVFFQPDGWVSVPEIGPGVYLYNQPLNFKVTLIAIDGKQVAPVHNVTGGGGLSSRNLTAWDVLSWPDDHHLDSPYLEDGLPFWETMQAITYIQEDAENTGQQVIYLRLIGGKSPAEHMVEAFPEGSAITIDNAAHIVIRDCEISGGDSGVIITGESAQFNDIRNCSVFMGTDRIQLIGNSSNNVIRDCRLQMRFIGAKPGAWGGGAEMPTLEGRKDAAGKRFVYNFYKGWASEHHTSDDRSITMRDTNNNLVWNCDLNGGLIGISLNHVSDIFIQNNRVRHHSSVGTSVRDHATRVHYDGNYFEDNSINFRLHRLNEDSGRVVWLTNNISVLPENLGNHVYCHVTPEKESIDPDATPQIYIIHNVFLGGDRGIRLPRATHAGEGLPKFIILNNLFSVGGSALSGASDLMKQEAPVGAFDYNLIIQDPARDIPESPWFGKNNLVAQDASIVPPALDLRKQWEIHGRALESIPYLYHALPDGEMPKIGVMFPSAK